MLNERGAPNIELFALTVLRTAQIISFFITVSHQKAILSILIEAAAQASFRL
jgi:hypothetical protein